MKFAIALLLVSAEAINIKMTPLAGHYPADNTCVNVRKDSGIEENCSAVGNSAWEPDVPLESPADLGWEPGFEALAWFSAAPCKDGRPTAGKPNYSSTRAKIDFTNHGEFSAQATGFPGERFAEQFFGKLEIDEAGEYSFSTNSDDGSRLFINGEKIVENWGLHGTRYVEGEARLSKGYHDIKVAMFENGGGASAYA